MTVQCGYLLPPCSLAQRSLAQRAAARAEALQGLLGRAAHAAQEGRVQQAAERAQRQVLSARRQPGQR